MKTRKKNRRLVVQLDDHNSYQGEIICNALRVTIQRDAFRKILKQLNDSLERVQNKMKYENL